MSQTQLDKLTDAAACALTAAIWLSKVDSSWEAKKNLMVKSCFTQVGSNLHVMASTLQDHINRKTNVAKVFSEAYQVYRQNEQIIEI